MKRVNEVRFLRAITDPFWRRAVLAAAQRPKRGVYRPQAFNRRRGR